MKPVKDSVILRRARNKIKRGSEMYICTAIRNSQGPHDQKESLRAWVRLMLRGHSTYESWLHRYRSRSYWNMSYMDRRNGRLQWLDWMIAYCEKEEAK